MKLLYTNQQIRTLEQLAIESGISEFQLMQTAARAAWTAILHDWPDVRNLKIFCGKGNNGGDGYALATLAAKENLRVNVYHIGHLEDLQGAARLAYFECRKTNCIIQPYHSDIDVSDAGLLIDALLGTGLKGEVKAPYSEVIGFINQSQKPVFALDCPSGLDVDTGSVLGVASIATKTITFIGYKQGLFTKDALDYCGELLMHNLDLKQKIFTKVPTNVFAITHSDFSNAFLPRKRNVHKGNFGHVLIGGGDFGYAGAIAMSGMAALRVGAGLVSLATHKEHASIATSLHPELMCHDVKKLAALMKKATVIALGPGLGQNAWSEQVFAKMIAYSRLVDADGLNFLSKTPHRKQDWILTPHPGEAARLLNCSISDIQADRFQAVAKLQKKYSGVIILKGAGTLIADENAVYLCCDGNPGMASAGMGDVLTGILAGLLAQDYSAIEAAKIGVCIHAKAADMAAQQGERGLVATDLLFCLRKLVNV